MSVTIQRTGAAVQVLEGAHTRTEGTSMQLFTGEWAGPFAVISWPCTNQSPSRRTMDLCQHLPTPANSCQPNPTQPSPALPSARAWSA